VLASWHNHATIWHNGGIDGFHSLVEMMPDQHLGFVILSNTGDSPLEAAFADIIFSNLVPAADESNPTAGAVSGAGAPLTEAAVKELTGSYQTAAFTAKIADVDGKASLVVPGQPAYPLMQKDKDLLISPALPASYSVTVKRDSAGKVSGLTIKQPGANTELVRAADYEAPLTPDELISKAIEAAGGEAVLHKHTSEVTTSSLDLINEGVTGEATVFRRAPNSESSQLTFEALGRKIGSQREYFDGSAGGTESSFSQREPLNPSKIRDAKARDDFNELLHANNLFKEIAITGTEKVNGEDAYVVSLTPSSGNATTEYYSTKSFLLLRRDTASEEGPSTVYYSDYRAIDGQMVPFKIVEEQRAGGQIVMFVKDVKFNAAISDSEFKPKP
ncbi:MAG TPA: hypothetical protein VI756_05945, partial [Blastocatellia bacterium]